LYTFDNTTIENVELSGEFTVIGKSYEPSSADSFYKLEVSNGSGSGTYAYNSQVIVKADKAPDGKIFSYWTADGLYLTDEDKASSMIIIRMPDGAVALKANYTVAKAVKPILTEPKKSETVYATDKDKNYVSMKVAVKKEDNNTYSYQWQFSEVQYSGWVNIAGADAQKSVYKAQVKKSGKKFYRCVVTATDKRASGSNRTASTTSEVLYVGYIYIDFTYNFEYKGHTESVTMRLPRDVSKTLYPKYNFQYRHSNKMKKNDGEYDYSRYVNNTADDSYINYIADIFGKISDERGFSRYEEASYVAAFVQSLKYTLIVNDPYGYGTFNESKTGMEYPRFPLEMLYNKGGDCEDFSILYAAIIKRMGYDVVLFDLPSHMAVGISSKSVERDAEVLIMTVFIIYLSNVPVTGISAMSLMIMQV